MGCILVLGTAPLLAQDTEADRTAPFTAAERESVYSAAIQRRADAVIAALKLQDTNRIARVHTAVMAQYRALRARDEAIDTMFDTLSHNVPGVATNRAAILPILSRQLHEQFLARLQKDLSPEQVETVKDIMTYDKVKVTYDAYCQIFPALTAPQKAEVLKLLTAAREEAMDGGSADEKSAIFQKYKNQINARLEAQGHSVSQAYKDWEAKQAKLDRAPIENPRALPSSN